VFLFYFLPDCYVGLIIRGEIMELKEKIINTAVLLLNLLEHCDDEDFYDYVISAVWNNDVMALYDLEESLAE